MNVRGLLQHKGNKVFTVHSTSTVATALELMKLHNVGALVVSDDERTLLGLYSERDVVRDLTRFGDDLLKTQVHEVMQHSPKTCAPTDQIDELMRMMTHFRARHVAVIDSGELKGLLSVGDVVKHRLAELETETEVLRDRLAGR
ncbi:MAG: CBS domain-containing protein [Gemmatimonadota bacterium]